MTTNLNSRSVPGSAGGIIFQFDRALYHLASSGPNSEVGIETLDDVSVRTLDELTIWEQDKLSFQSSGHPLTDKSENLWKTLLAWLQKLAILGDNCGPLELHVTTNRSVPDCLVRRMSKATADAEIAKCIVELRAAGTSKDKDLQALMTAVLAFSDDQVGKVIKLLRLFDGSDGAAGIELRKKTIAALDLPRGVPADVIIDALAGWVKDTVMAQWENHKPGWIHHEAFNERKHLLIRQLYARRIRERPEHEILLTDSDRTSARPRRFVEHLMFVNADEDIILDAIDEFLRFSAEYSRLLVEGEVDKNDWDSFFDDMRRRWKNILRRHQLNRGSASKEVLGQRILVDTTSADYLPNLGEFQTAHGYFAAGGYHRLADDDRVWWDPEYQGTSKGK